MLALWSFLDTCCMLDRHLDFIFIKEEDGIRDGTVTGVQTCALPISGTVRFCLISSSSSRRSKSLSLQGDPRKALAPPKNSEYYRTHGKGGRYRRFRIHRLPSCCGARKTRVRRACRRQFRGRAYGVEDTPQGDIP